MILIESVSTCSAQPVASVACSAHNTPDWRNVRMELYQRCCKESICHCVFRSVLFGSCLLLFLCVSMYPGLWSIGVRLHSVLAGSYAPGHHSVLLINSPNEQAAKDIGRAIMQKRMAASINILPRTSTMYYWKGEVQDATEIMMMVKTKTSKIQKVIDYVRSVHPYENPEVLSLTVADGSLTYMNWMDEAVPDD